MDLDLLRSLGAAEHFAENQTVFMQNDIGTGMYIVLKGMFGVYIHSFSGFPVRVAGVAAGSFFGEMAFIDNSPRSATVIAEQDSVALRIGKDGFEQLLTKSPDMAAAILNSLRDRVFSTADRVRKTGGEAPEPSQQLRTMRFNDGKSGMALLSMLSSKLRRLNDLLASGTQEAGPLVAQAEREDVITLLPDGYIPFDLKDGNSNDGILRKIKVICPYCGVESDAYIPVFSLLRESHTMLDGRVTYANFDILRYTNVICTNCCYTDNYLMFTKLRFTPETPRFQGNQFQNAEGFTGYGEHMNHTLDETVMSCYMHIDSLIRVSGDSRRFAKAWMHLYWIYGDHNRTAHMRTAAKRARYYYTVDLDKNAQLLSDTDRMRRYAILGELSAALEEYGTALQYYKESLYLGRAMNNDLYRKHKKRYGELKRI